MTPDDPDNQEEQSGEETPSDGTAPEVPDAITPPVPAEPPVRVYYSPDGGAPLIPRFVKGQSGNPTRKGEGSYGGMFRVHLNALRNKTEQELRNIAKAKSAKAVRRAAAMHLLETLEHPDLADYEKLFDGTYSLKDLRDAGVPTDCIKKLKGKVRKIGNGDGKGTVTEREIEFYDRATAARDKAIGHTDGTPISRSESNVRVERTTLDLSRLPIEDMRVLEQIMRRNQQAQIEATPAQPQLPSPEDAS